MVDSMCIYIGTIIKNPEMLRFILDYLKTKKVCNYAVKKLITFRNKICS